MAAAHIYTATVAWARGEQVFTDGRYSRAHELRFDGGVVVPGSSAPGVVRPPLSRVDAIDPEEALIASASACHMLFFLDFARRAGFRVDSYVDAAEAVMTPNESGKLFVSRIALRPDIRFSGEKLPSEAEIAGLHHHAHEECFIANSLRAEIVVEPPRA